MKKEIVAFLNSNGGTIYVGVKDNGEIVPFEKYKDRDELDIKLSSWIMQAFYPLPANYIKHYFNDDKVLTI